MRLKQIRYFCISVLAIFAISGCGSEKDQSSQSMAEVTADEPVTAHENSDRSVRRADNGTLGELPDKEFVTMKGESVKLSDYRGEILMVNFWATWCGPCRKEIPELVKLKEKYGDQGFEIIGVALDEEGFEVVEPFLQQFGINYTIVADDYSYGNELGGIYMVPTTYLVNKEGKIAFRKIGEITVENIESKITELL